MAIVTTDSKYYSNIAAAIREKAGVATAYTPEEMPSGIAEVYDAGKQAEYDRFWDAYQQNGNRTDYQNAFAGVGWNNDTFKPKYDIVPKWGGSTNMFKIMTFEGSLKEHLNSLGVKLDLSMVISAPYLFSDCTKITELPDIDLSGVTGLATYVFYNCTSLITVKIKLPATVTELTNSFKNCSSLENLTIEGVIPCNIDVSSCTKLTHESLMSIINALADKSSDTSGTTWKVTLGTTNLAKLTDAEKAIAAAKKWTLA